METGILRMLKVSGSTKLKDQLSFSSSSKAEYQFFVMSEEGDMLIDQSQMPEEFIDSLMDGKIKVGDEVHVFRDKGVIKLTKV